MTARASAGFDAVAARHGVLGGAEPGRQGALLLQDDIVVGQRLSSGLAEVARAGDAAVLPLLDSLEVLMAVLPGRRDAGPFVELAADLADRTGRKVQLPGEFSELASGRSTSIPAKAARRLLRCLPSRPDAVSRPQRPVHGFGGRL